MNTQHNARPKFLRYFFIALLLLLAGLSLGFGGRIAWSDAKTLHARWLVSEWRDGNGPAMSPELWQGVRHDLQQALVNVPANAALHDDLGFIYATRAASLGEPEPASALFVYQQQLLTEALQHYRASTALRPTFPYSWAYLALAKQLLGQVDDELWAAFDKAYHYGHSEAGVQPTLAQIAFMNWKTIGAKRQQNMVQMVDTAHKQVQARLLAQAAQYQVALH